MLALECMPGMICYDRVRVERGRNVTPRDSRQPARSNVVIRGHGGVRVDQGGMEQAKGSTTSLAIMQPDTNSRAFKREVNNGASCEALAVSKAGDDVCVHRQWAFLGNTAMGLWGNTSVHNVSRWLRTRGRQNENAWAPWHDTRDTTRRGARDCVNNPSKSQTLLLCCCRYRGAMLGDDAETRHC
jgi:hypothetical protein